jgi:transposase
MVTLSFSKALVQSLEETLKRASELNNVGLYKRALSLLWLHEGQSQVTIARRLRVDVKTVANWFKSFLRRGMNGLQGHHYQGRGRKSKLTKAQKCALYTMVEQGPEANGFDIGVWNSAMIAELIWRHWEVEYNPRYVSSLLKSLGLSYQKARFVSDQSDEEAYEQARQRWVKETWPRLLEQAKKTKAVILFTDEVSFALWGSLGRTWAPRGQQPTVKTTGQRKGLKMFGAIDFHSGAFYYREARCYKLTAQALKQLKTQGLCAEAASALKALKGTVYPTQAQFMGALQQILGSELTQRYHRALIKAAEGNGKFNSETYKEFLTQLLEQIDQPIILIEDSVSYHRSQAVEQFCAEQGQRLYKEALPKFSPDFNPIEKLWKNTKRDATHLKYFKSFADLRASVLKAFHHYLEEAAKVICVMKKLRAQADVA